MKLKKIFGMLAISVSLITLSACGSTKSSAKEDSSKVFELNLNVAASPTSAFNKNVAVPWAEYVEEQTDGVVKVNVFPSAGLGTLNTAFDDITAGVYEAGMVPPGLHMDTPLYPLTIAEIPFLVNSPEIAQKVLTKYVDKFMKDAFVEGTFMGVSSTDPFQIFATKPIKSVKDIENLKISDSVTARINFYKSLGAAPVSVTNTELYESLERNVVTAASYTAVGASGFKLEEVAPYMTKIDFAVSIQPFLMNTGFLNSLPKDIKKQFIEDIGPKYADLITELYTNGAEESIKTYEETVKKQGGGVYVPSEQEMKEIKEPVKKQMEAWVKEADKRGYKGQEMMDYFVGLIEAEGVKIPK
jgi:TRAP-type transport system periplasmic protein